MRETKVDAWRGIHFGDGETSHKDVELPGSLSPRRGRPTRGPLLPGGWPRTTRSLSSGAHPGVDARHSPPECRWFITVRKFLIHLHCIGRDPFALSRRLQHLFLVTGKPARSTIIITSSGRYGRNQSLKKGVITGGTKDDVPGGS